MDKGMIKTTSQTLICRDAIDEMRKMSDASVSLIVTDPPYNLGKDYGNTSDMMTMDDYMSFSRAWLSEAKRVLADDGTIYVFMGMRFISYLYAIMEKELNLSFNSWITWFYTQGTGKTRGFSPRHDDILMFTKDPKRFVFNLDDIRVPQKFYRSVNNMRGANPGNVWEFSHTHYCNRNRTAHPTQKPEALFERMIKASSNAGDVVLDPFVGSGTALRVCQQTGRVGIGIDINPDYIAMANARLNERFDGFDSIDERMKRLPNNLGDGATKDAYIKNHLQWFLAGHPEVASEIIKDESLVSSSVLSLFN